MVFLSLLLGLLGLVVLAAFVYSATSCAETIAWWTGLGRNRAAPGSPIVIPPPDPGTPLADQYIIYLSGVGRNSGEEVPDKEAQFLDLIERGVPGSVIVRDVFPYSPSSTPLTENRLFPGLWTGIPKLARRNRRYMILYHLIYYRNLLQVMASRDWEYGPYYAYGFAKEMMKGLLRYGYRPEEPRPVTILCISGGGQLSQAAATYMKEWLGYKVRVISVGSVLADDVSTGDLGEVVHLSGSQDVTQFVGRVLGWLSWPIHPNSEWNRFVREGHLRWIPVGPMKHMGWGDYFSRSVKLPDGTPHVQRTAEVVVGLLSSGESYNALGAGAASSSRTPEIAREVVPPVGPSVQMPGEA